ncbi:MAG: hypothetical protein ACI87Q_001333 [Pseudohongiellaceae bacterium]
MRSSNSKKSTITQRALARVIIGKIKGIGNEKNTRDIIHASYSDFVF